jgi:hypothetical protein
MSSWLANSGQAARVAIDRSDLWFAGAVVAFAGAGWIVLLGTVAPSPDSADAAGLGLELAASSWWPWNLVVLAVVIVSGLASLLLVIAFGEVAIRMGISDPVTDDPPPTVPQAMAALGLPALLVGLGALAVGWLTAPSIFGLVTGPNADAPLGVRVVEATWPYLLMLGIGIVLAQALGAARLHRSRRAVHRPRRPARPPLVAQALVTMAAFLGFQLVTAVTLGVLWEPLAQRLAVAGLTEPTTLVLLLGFVWIWLVLVIMAGVVQAWISAWWKVELAPRGGG